jgi:hypothetical protein
VNGTIAVPLMPKRTVLETRSGVSASPTRGSWKLAGRGVKLAARAVSPLPLSPWHVAQCSMNKARPRIGSGTAVGASARWNEPVTAPRTSVTAAPT